LKLDPNFVQARLWFGRPFLQKGLYKEAIAELTEAAKLSKDSTVALATLGQAYAASGDKKRAQQILDRLKERSKQQYVPSYWIALLYLSLGDKRQTFEWLDRAYEERSSWLAWIKVEPRFDPIRDDPKFTKLLQRMGLLSQDKLSSKRELGISAWLKGPKQSFDALNFSSHL